MEWHLPLFFFKPLDKGTPYCIALGGADEVQYLFCMKTSSLSINRWSSRPQLMNEGAKKIHHWLPLLSPADEDSPRCLFGARADASYSSSWWRSSAFSFRKSSMKVKYEYHPVFFSSAPDHRKFLCSFSRAWRTWHLESRKHVRVRSVEARTFLVVPGPR